MCIPSPFITKDLEFDKDTDYSGKEVERNAQISNEMQQRAKILSHSTQRKLRTKRVQDALQVISNKKEEELQKCQSLHKKNHEAEEKLARVSNNSDYETITLTNFFALDKKMLKSFTYVRIFTTSTAPKGQAKRIPDKKGKVEEAQQGIEHLLLIAYKTRNLPIILPIPDEDDDGNVLVIPTPINESNASEQEPPDLIPEPSIASFSPSDFLQNSNRLSLIRKNVRGVLNNEDREVSITMREQADQVGLILKGRL